ncbi:MAG: hypothetical protein HPAVJP_4400 [Candidatus Hepatoplasma vulgare]|nr:MAG: hypothetical protein HPAVJP_4400 [Candidatus Hepatoplasma sp.]
MKFHEKVLNIKEKNKHSSLFWLFFLFLIIIAFLIPITIIFTNIFTIISSFFTFIAFFLTIFIWKESNETTKKLKINITESKKISINLEETTKNIEEILKKQDKTLTHVLSLMKEDLLLKENEHLINDKINNNIKEDIYNNLKFSLDDFNEINNISNKSIENRNIIEETKK